MWLLKGAFLGLWLFGFGTLAFLWFSFFRHLSRNSAVSTQLISGATTQNLWWWASLIACVVLGCALVRSWSGKSSGVLWIFLLVTSVIPASLFGLYAFLLFKLREAARAGH